MIGGLAFAEIGLGFQKATSLRVFRSGVFCFMAGDWPLFASFVVLNRFEFCGKGARKISVAFFSIGESSARSFLISFAFILFFDAPYWREYTP